MWEWYDTEEDYDQDDVLLTKTPVTQTIPRLAPTDDESLNRGLALMSSMSSEEYADMFVSVDGEPL